ncbi:MAG: SUMF1/EgtB/PvdO family nonheme iron enzyme [Deltaproteobacteria bacterium]|nr:SUMF1/EgtB/PvdO family nonheme iron enzyme [Deltaproteobacteria bacterium]
MSPARTPEAFVVCTEPPADMICIPGGPFVRGSDDGNADERPRGEVTVSTFHIDRHEVTNADFRRCMAAGVCELAHHYAGFNNDDQPVVAIDWINAAAYCAWVSKRLPTEAEWEKAARGTDGRTYPWGEDPPTCERAHYADCDPRASKPVGSFTPGPWGISDMAGNAYEFVQDWYSPCYRGCPDECGDDCFGTDPKGPCGGAERCPGRDRRLLRGGSWFWESDQVRTSSRRGMRPDSRGHRLGFRCAVDAPPPGPVGAPQPPDDGIAPLTPAEREAFEGVEAEALRARPVDARHWTNSNESDHALWFPTVAGVGGGYLGVGSDQNFSLFAAARSSFVWLMDYDTVVLQANRIYRALILASASPQEFLLRWDSFERKVTEAVVAEAEAGAEDLPELLAQLDENFEAAGNYFHKVAARTEAGAPGSWLADPALYRVVRRLFQEGRVRIVGGDLTRELPGRIAAAQAALGVPMRVVYLSNAEQYFAYGDAFRSAIWAMPFDERSVILRTVSRWLPDRSRHAWHYQVEPAAHFAETLRGGVERFSDMEEQATYVPTGGLSWLGEEER